jgi:hypothetical protein
MISPTAREPLLFTAPHAELAKAEILSTAVVSFSVTQLPLTIELTARE